MMKSMKIQSVASTTKLNVKANVPQQRRMNSSSKTPIKGESILSTHQITREKLDYLLDLATHFRVNKEKGNFAAFDTVLKNKILGNLFFEPSTRTSSSFQAAMLRLGGSVIKIDEQTSSAQKGETIPDTIRTMNNFVDVIAMRHPQIGSAKLAAQFSKVPVLNAGDGAGEHPTQALIDTLCIRTELGKTENLNITLVGDLKYGRTVHSLTTLLSLFKGLKLNYVAPPSLAMPNDVIESLKSKGIQQNIYTKLEDKLLAESDVLYITRVQKERFANIEDYNKVKGVYIISPETMKKVKTNSLLMHPLPRVDEIETGVDSDPRAMYFKQPGYGLYMRMALLAGVLGAA